MTLNPPRRVRVALYLFGMVLTPLVAYGFDTGHIGTAEVTLFGAYIALAFAIAAGNVPSNG